MSTEIVQVKCGTYSTPVGDLTVGMGENRTTVLTLDTAGYSGKVSWRFGDNGVFSNMQVHTKEVKPPSGPPQIGDVITTCEHITPKYTGEVFRRKAPTGIETVVCPECVEQKVQIADTAVHIMDREIWEKVLGPCVTVTDLED